MEKCHECGVMEHPIFLYVNHKETCSSWGTEEGGKVCKHCGSRAYEQSGKMIHRPVCPFYLALDVDPRSGLQSLIEHDLKGDLVSVDGFIVRAAKIASEAHHGQTRKYTNDPYIFHPMRVAGRVTLLFKATPIEIAAAWLHDVFEDSAMREKDLADRGMPDSVIAYVRALTNPSKEMPKGVPRATRKATDFEHLAKQSVWVKTIKLIDRIDNLMELSWQDKEFMALYCRESRGLVEALGEVDEDIKKEILNIIDYFEHELSGMQKEIL